MNVSRRSFDSYKLISAVVILHFIPGSLVGQIPDTILSAGDTLVSEAQITDSDSLMASSDSLDQVVRIFPQMASLFPPSYEAGVWHYNRQAILSSSAMTLAELLELIPGTMVLRGGDYGTPETAVSFGLASGRIKIFWDGLEWTPLDTGVPDLSRITLAGVKEVRVERRMTGLRIELISLEPSESIPETVIQVGTGDLGTNLLRAELSHPDVLGGALTFAMDRLETRGPNFQNRGSLSGIGVRYGLHMGDKGGLIFDLKSSTPQNDNADLVGKVKRSDWNIRGRWRLLEGLVGEAFVGSSSLAEDSKESASDYHQEYSGRQLGIRANYEIGDLWAAGNARMFSGSMMREKAYDFKVGTNQKNLVAVEASVQGEYWSEQKVSSLGFQAVTAPLLGFSFFGSYEDGTAGSAFISGIQESDKETNVPEIFTKRKGSRLGANFSWGGIDISAAMLHFHADSLRPLGLPIELGSVSLKGGDRNGFEGEINLPLPIRGFKIEGTGQIWEEESSYLPRRMWKGALTYHGLFKESENLEVWAKAGVIGRDSMLLRTLELDSNHLTRVAALQRWFAHIQVRVVTLNIFVRWENMLGKIDNYDFPGRKQPRFRTIYGIKWILSN